MLNRQLPPVLQTSLLVRPLLQLASVSEADIQQDLNHSKIFRAVYWAYYHTIAPLGRALSQNAFLLRAVAYFHLISVCLMLCALPVASTGVIGGLIWISFGFSLLRWLTGAVVIRWTILDVWVKLFFLTALLACAFSSYTTTSCVGLLKLWTYYSVYLNVRILLTAAPKQLFGLLGLLSILGLSQVLVAFWQYVNHVQPMATWQDPTLNPELQMTRVWGTLKPANPNLLAGFLMPILPMPLITLSLWCERNDKAPRWQKIAWFMGALAVSLLFLLGLVLTGSRGAFLALAVVGASLFLFLGHWLWHHPTLKPLAYLKSVWLLSGLMSIGAVLMGILAIPALKTRVLSIFAFRQDSSNSFRMNVWSSTWQMIQDNWLFGIGPGNDTYKLVYGLYMVSGYSALSAYSIFLEIWVEQGILGLLVFIVLFKLMSMWLVMALYSGRRLIEQWVLALLWLAVLGSILYGLFDTIWYRPNVSTLFWLVVAAYGVWYQTRIQPADSELSSELPLGRQPVQ